MAAATPAGVGLPPQDQHPEQQPDGHGEDSGRRRDPASAPAPLCAGRTGSVNKCNAAHPPSPSCPGGQAGESDSIHRAVAVVAHVVAHLARLHLADQAPSRGHALPLPCVIGRGRPRGRPPPIGTGRAAGAAWNAELGPPFRPDRPPPPPLSAAVAV